MNVNDVFEFLYKDIGNFSHAKKNRARYDEKCVLFFV
jgi:hypothetical protein